MLGKKMETYDLKEIMSGDDEDCLWVTLGFSSDLEELDVLHIVCGKWIDPQGRKTGMDGIYLERFDQAYSGYKGADSIGVSPSIIKIGLNRKGKKALGFKGAVTFRVPKKLKGLSKALKVFAKMSGYDCGRIIEIAQQSTPGDADKPCA